MTEHEIERCPVCGHRCELHPADDNWEERVCCQDGSCGYSIECEYRALAKHNHISRGLRLLREVAELLPRMLDTAQDWRDWRRTTKGIEAWAKEKGKGEA
jgi:hypothetical protein